MSTVQDEEFQRMDAFPEVGPNENEQSIPFTDALIVDVTFCVVNQIKFVIVELKKNSSNKSLFS